MLLRRILGGIVCRSSTGVNVCMGASGSKAPDANGAASLKTSSLQQSSSHKNTSAKGHIDLPSEKQQEVKLAINSSISSRPSSVSSPSAARMSSEGSTSPPSSAPLPPPMSHKKCRNGLYTRTQDVERCPVPDDRVSWSVPFEDYKPVEFTGPSVANKPVWADPDFKNEGGTAEWNTLDGKVDRRSHMDQYQIVDGLPRNPIGRTGICGRGHLGRWGPNHAADPIVTRWKRTETGDIVMQEGQEGHPVLQFIAVLRSDNGEWALPGGMVDPGERVSTTLKREFLEEALDVANMSEETKQSVQDRVGQIFQGGKEVYKGYVDDPRNTDNAWMETVAVNFHDETGDSVGKFKLHAGDDAVGVQWADMNSKLALYASHSDFISKVAAMHKAFW